MVICEVSFGSVARSMQKCTNVGHCRAQEELQILRII
jgi:hypothetical protein